MESFTDGASPMVSVIHRGSAPLCACYLANVNDGTCGRPSFGERWRIDGREIKRRDRDRNLGV